MHLQTFTGQKFYPWAPAFESVRDEDVAHALSMLCRFGGHTPYHYSVAQHSVMMVQAMERDGHETMVLQYGLLHDAAEAYVGDLILPLKKYIEAYVGVEEKVDSTVLLAFGLTQMPPDVAAIVKEYDTRMLATEASQLFNATGDDWPSIKGVKPLDISIEEWSPAYAKELFIAGLKVMDLSTQGGE